MSEKVLIIDIGNTATEFAVFENENSLDFLGFFKIPEQLEEAKKALKSYKNHGFLIEKGMIFSVVPHLNGEVQKIVQDVFGFALKVFDWNNYKLEKKNPKIKEAIGADLLADVVEAQKEFVTPVLIADFGTITKLLYVDEKGSFEGLSLIPGLETTLKTFSANTALLPELKKSTLPFGRLGLNTAESMLHGTYYSSVYYVKEVYKSLNKKNCKLVITGGNYRYIKDEFKNDIIDPHFTLKGMYLLYQEISK